MWTLSKCTLRCGTPSIKFNNFLLQHFNIYSIFCIRYLFSTESSADLLQSILLKNDHELLSFKPPCKVEWSVYRMSNKCKKYLQNEPNQFYLQSINKLNQFSFEFRRKFHIFSFIFSFIYTAILLVFF